MKLNLHSNSKQHSIYPISQRTNRANYSISQAQYGKTCDLVDKITAESIVKTKNKTRTYLKDKKQAHKKIFNIQDSSNIQVGQANKQNLREKQQKQKLKIDNLNRSRQIKRPITSKKLNAQFQKQMYWNGNNTYMITGIKYQYQKIKEALQTKTLQYEELLKTIHSTKNEQMKKYIQALQVESHILARNLQEVLKIKNTKITQIAQISPIILKENLIQKEQKIKKLREKNKQVKASLKQSQLRMTFLQKLIIDKDNNEHIMSKRCKAIQKERQSYQQKLKSLENQLNKLRGQHQEEVSKFKKQILQLNAFNRQSQTESRKQYALLINQLQRQNKYLQNLVNSWKDQMQKDMQSKNKRNLTLLKIEKQREKEKEGQFLFNSIFVSNFQVFMKSNNEQQAVQIKRTKPYTCDVKNSQNYTKNRRIQLHQIQNIIQTSRYRLINKEIDLNQFMTNFQPKNQDQWNKQYINMKEVRQIFKGIIELPQKQAQMMARYLIQHVAAQFVYTDDLNEHHRSVVKSIIRNIYRQYKIYKDEKGQFQQTIRSYRNKLQFSLQSITKSGLVSSQKFLDLLKSLSIKVNQGFDIYCISKMLIKSESLDKLQYKHLFQSIDPLKATEDHVHNEKRASQ